MLGLSPRSRFIVEILTVLAIIGATGGCIDSLHGLWGIGSFSWWIGVPLTVVAAVVFDWGEYAFFVGKFNFHTGLAYRFRRYMATNRIEGEKAWWNRVQRFVDGKEKEEDEGI